MLGLEELMARRPAQLSGGQRQRVAMGRALVREPQVFLLDEPLSNLDAKLRTTMRAELARLHERLGITTVYVTHDQVEAMTLGQRVAVLRDGVLQQFGDPQDAVPPAGQPVRRGVHRLADDEPRERALRRRAGGVRGLLAAAAGEFAGTRGDVVLGLRPGSFELAGPWTDPELPRMRGRGRARRGARRRGAGLVPRRRAGGPGRGGAHRRGAPAGRRPAARASSRACAGAWTSGPGERLELAVDHRELHLFDPESGRALRESASPSRPAPGTCALAAAASAARSSASGHDAPPSSAARKPPSAESPLPTG